ncbi:hypothetical protein [Candidatus Lokiarchaeum ossiferum]|uniref:hypothetical protein n=1 Tax=Candidatus Lokiarchaeum ossiferum TaxID=2951803 RepID=UPI00352D45BB
MQSRNSPIPKKFCTQCSTQLEPRLVEKLLLGKEVFCESCGHQFEIGSKDQLRKHIQTQSPQAIPKIQPVQPRYTPGPASIKPAKPSTSVKFEQFDANKYASLPANKQLIDIKGYKTIRKSNRKEFQKIKKQNRKAFKRPMVRDRRKYKKIIKNNKRLYKATVKNNKRIYKITKLSNINADKITQKQIDKEFKTVKKANRKKHKTSLKNISKEYKRTARLNKKTFRKTKRRNSRSFQEKLRYNAKAFNRVLKTGEASQNYMVKFEPIPYEVKEFQAYDPGDTAKPPELVQISTKRHKFDPMTGKPITKQMRFDPMTGKPLLNQTEKAPTSFPQHIPEAKKNIPQQEISSPKPFPPMQIQELFTVLDDSVREQLMNLPISEEERNLLAKSFIYLNPVQQMKYLEELQHVNEYNEAEYEEFINRIKTLQIPTNQQDYLISQLHYIPDTHHHDFVSTLETSKNEEADENVTPTPEKEIKTEPSKETIQVLEDIDPIISKEQEEQTIQEELAKKEKQKKEMERIKQLEEQRKKSEQEKLELEGLKHEKRELERLKRVKDLKSKIKGEKQDSSEKDDLEDKPKETSNDSENTDKSTSSKQKLTS